MSDQREAGMPAPPEAPPEAPNDAPSEAVTQLEAVELRGRELTPEELADLGRKVEAALLTSDRAMPAAKLAEALGVPTRAVMTAIASLNEVYQESGRSFRLELVAGGWQVLTLPEFADVLAALHRKKQDHRLSPAALETLAVIAYKQPVIRAEIENIRGVACGEVLRSLMERHLVKVVGRAEEIGRPMLYGTTRQFLEVFGLGTLKDLPKVEELRTGSTRSPQDAPEATREA